MIGWLIVALQGAPIAVTCPPTVSIHDRPKTVCVRAGGQILTPQIRFSRDHRSVHRSSQATISTIAKLLISKRIQHISVRTHDQIPDRYGFSKTARRARALTAALVAHGVDAAVIDAVGYGEQQPLVSRHDPAAPHVNTRVEFWLGVDGLRVR